MTLVACVGAAGARAAEPGSIELTQKCVTTQTVAILCPRDTAPLPAGLVIAASSICVKPDDASKVTVAVCVMSDMASLPTGGRIAVNSNFGVFRPPSGERHMWATGGQTDVLATTILPAPGGGVRLAAITTGDVALPAAPSRSITIADRLLVQVMWWLCGSGRTVCAYPPSSPTISRMVVPVEAKR